MDLVFERLVRRQGGALPGRGQPDARADVYLEMADAVINGRTLVRLDRQDAEARAGLVSDDLLERVRTSHRFAHDVLGDYAAVTRMADLDGENLLLVHQAPRPLLRTIRLWMQRRLSDAATAGDTLSIWNRLVLICDRLAGADGARWRDVPFEALLNLGPVEEVLDALVPALLANDKGQLARLVEVTERRARVHPASEVTPRCDELDVVLSTPVVSFLVRHSQLFPAHLHAAAARLVRAHLLSLGDHINEDTSAHFPRAHAISAALIEWAVGPRRSEHILDVVEALAMLAKHLGVSAQQFLVERGRREPTEIAPAVEEVLAAQQLARHQPVLLLTLAGLYYLDRDLADDAPSSAQVPGNAYRSGRGYFGADGEDGTRQHFPRGPRERALLVSIDKFLFTLRV